MGRVIKGSHFGSSGCVPTSMIGKCPAATETEGVVMWSSVLEFSSNLFFTEAHVVPELNIGKDLLPNRELN